MEQKIIFREMLSEIKALADTRDNRLTTKEIDDFFANTHLNPEQMELVYQYLQSQKIQVEGYGKAAPEGTAQTGESGEETVTEEAEKEDAAEDSGMTKQIARSLELYLDEIGKIEKLEAPEELELFHLAAAGDAASRSRLIELYLPMVCQLAGDYEGEECLAEDLIQEGNVGLLLAMKALEPRDSLAAYQVQLMNAVNQYMEDVLREQKDIREMGDGIVKRVNHLSQAIHNLEEDLEHKVSVEELSAYLEMPAEEIRDILKMAGDELEVEGKEDR